MVPVARIDSKRAMVGRRGPWRGDVSDARERRNWITFDGAELGGVSVFGMPNNGDGATDSNIGTIAVMAFVPAKGSLGAVTGPAATATLTAPHIFRFPFRGAATISIVRFAGLGFGCPVAS